MGGQESQARFLGNSAAAGLCAAVSSGTPGRALRKIRAWHISQDLIQESLWSHPSPLDSHFSDSWEVVAQKTLQGSRTVRLPSTLPTRWDCWNEFVLHACLRSPWRAQAQAPYCTRHVGSQC